MAKELEHVIAIDDEVGWRNDRTGHVFMQSGRIIYRGVTIDADPNEVYREFLRDGATLVDHQAIPDTNLVQLFGFFITNDGTIN